MIGPSSTAAEILTHLQTLRSEETLAGMSRFGIVTDNALGISNPVLQTVARRVKKETARAMALWATGLREARLLALYTIDPADLDASTAKDLAGAFNSWEIVDAAADLFVEARLDDLIAQFAADDREFVRRTAFAMIAGAAVHRKKDGDDTLIAYLPLIRQTANDPRNFVRKAVNWALRNIGKRSIACHVAALDLARELAKDNDKTARWIGSHALKEFGDPSRIAKLKT